MKTHTVVVALLLGVLLACKSGDSGQGNQATPNASATPQKATLAVGSTVVGRWSGLSFYEGNVKALDGNRPTVAWTDGSEPSAVDPGEVFLIPEVGHDPKVSVGDHVLARRGSGSRWNGARVTSVSADTVGVAYVEGGRGDVAPHQVIGLPRHLQKEFADNAAKRDFLAEAQSKRPPRAVGFRPQVGQRVLGVWGTTWYSGVVRTAGATKAKIAWDDGTSPSSVEYDQVAPFPAGESRLASTNDLVLVKPQSGHNWVFGKVTRIEESSAFVQLETGTERQLSKAEYVILQ
jgi:hypothetical protein